jgi:transposase-like protein
MRKSTIEEGKECPKCGSKEGQAYNGYTKAGTQICRCFKCKNRYTINPKRRAYPEEIRELAIKEYLSGLSGRGVGKIHGMSGNNVINWIKKKPQIVDK